MTAETVTILKAVLDLGFSGVLLSFIYVIWKDRTENNTNKEKVIVHKDAELAELNDKVLTVLQSNIQVNTELKHAVDGNTKAVETLSSAVFKVLSNSGK